MTITLDKDFFLDEKRLDAFCSALGATGDLDKAHEADIKQIRTQMPMDVKLVIDDPMCVKLKGNIYVIDNANCYFRMSEAERGDFFVTVDEVNLWKRKLGMEV